MHRPRGQGGGTRLVFRTCEVHVAGKPSASLLFSHLGTTWFCQCPSGVFWRSCSIPRHKTHYPAAAFGDTKSPSAEFRGSTVGYAFSTLRELRECSEHTREKPRERATNFCKAPCASPRPGISWNRLPWCAEPTCRRAGLWMAEMAWMPLR